MDDRLRTHLEAANPWLRDLAAFPEVARSRFAAPYVQRLLPAADDWPVAGRAHLLIGARQVGKSTWLWHRLREAGTPPLFIDAGELLVRSWAVSSALASRDIQALVGPAAPVLLDEAQNLDEAGLFVKGLVDSGLPNPLYVTGSSSWHLGSRTRESLAGRAVRARMDPLSLAEVSAGVAGMSETIRRAQVRELALRQTVVGGYPDAWLAQEPERVLFRLLESFVIRDASDFFGIQQIDGFRRLLDLVAGQQGAVINTSEWASICEVSRPTVVRWLDILKEGQIVFSPRPFAGGRRAEATGRPKVYLCDPGIAAALLRRHTPFETREDRGRLLESWVGAELRKQVHPLHPGEELLFWRTRSGAEVDFVLRRGDELVGIEVKARALRKPRLSRSSRSFIDAYAPGRFYVLHLGDDFEETLGSTEILWRGPERLAAGPL